MAWMGLDYERSEETEAEDMKPSPKRHKGKPLPPLSPEALYTTMEIQLMEANGELRVAATRIASVLEMMRKHAESRNAPA